MYASAPDAIHVHHGVHLHRLTIGAYFFRPSHTTQRHGHAAPTVFVSLWGQLPDATSKGGQLYKQLTTCPMFGSFPTSTNSHTRKALLLGSTQFNTPSSLSVLARSLQGHSHYSTLTPLVQPFRLPPNIGIDGGYARATVQIAGSEYLGTRTPRFEPWPT